MHLMLQIGSKEVLLSTLVTALFLMGSAFGFVSLVLWVARNIGIAPKLNWRSTAGHHDQPPVE